MSRGQESQLIPNMANSTDVVQVITKCIENCETNKALEIFQDPSYTKSLIASSWDIIPLLCSKLDKETLNSQPALFTCCEKLLGIITEMASPEEALLEFIELAECPDNDVRFLALLKPLQRTLARMPTKRGQCLEWCLNLVANHVADLPEPDVRSLEGDERKLCDLYPSVQRAVHIYDSIVPFYEPFLEEVSLFSAQKCADKPVLTMRHRQRCVLAAFILHLLGKPLVQMDLEFDGKSKSRARCIAENLISSLKHVMSDIMPILLERISCQKKLNRDNYDAEPTYMFYEEDKVPILGLSNLLYLVLAGGMPRSFVPIVYHSVHVFIIGLHFSAEMLSHPHDLVIHKGLCLSDALLEMLSECSLSFDLLDLPVHKQFCLSLEKVVVYCEQQEFRRSGVKIFQKFILKMDLHARFQVFRNLFPLLEHSGVKGILVTMLKDTVHFVLQHSQDITSHIYHGNSLLKLMEIFCTLPNGTEVDLMDHCDHIIPLLNLIWYLVMADRADSLGLWCYASHLDQKFIQPLREALKMSRAHYELKIHQINEERMVKLEKKDDEKEKPQVTVTVHGEAVPDLTYAQKKQILDVALNKFSMMESLLNNIREIVEHRCSQR